MARKTTGKPVGAPKKAIDWRQFEYLCSLQCTQTEIAAMFAIHHETLRDRVKEQYGENYSSIYKRYAEKGYISLRKYQFDHAKKNASMAIFLGKVLLGQKEDNVSKDMMTTFCHMMKEKNEEAMKEMLVQKNEQP